MSLSVLKLWEQRCHAWLKTENQFNLCFESGNILERWDPFFLKTRVSGLFCASNVHRVHRTSVLQLRRCTVLILMRLVVLYGAFVPPRPSMPQTKYKTFRSNCSAMCLAGREHSPTVKQKEEKQQQKQPLPMARATERSGFPFPLCGPAAHGSSTPTGG